MQLGTLKLALVAAVALVSLPLMASGKMQSRPPGKPSLVPSGVEGYWFYLNPPKPKAAPPIPLARPHAPSGHEPGKACDEDATWTPKCGFVTPRSFAMQSKERDALLRNMVMNPGDPDAVRAVQDYTRWVLHQSIYAAHVWAYNKLQDPRKLDPAATSPISSFGLRLAFAVNATDQKAVWSAIHDFKGILILFTKSDCDYCHAQAGPLRMLASDTGLKIWDASLKGPCLSPFRNTCIPPAKSTLPARVLHVSLVPTMFLYLPGNVWIRVSAGLTDTHTIETRIYNLFVSWKAAATGAAKETGHTGLALDPSQLPKDSQQLKRLLMAAPGSTSEQAH